MLTVVRGVDVEEVEMALSVRGTSSLAGRLSVVLRDAWNARSMGLATVGVRELELGRGRFGGVR